MKYCSSFHKRTQLSKRQWLSASVYMVATKGWKKPTWYFGQETLHANQTRLRARGRWKCFKEQRIGGGEEGRERRVPLPPWRGNQNTVSWGSSCARVLSDIPVAGSSWSVHLLWHFCLRWARCQSGQHHWPFAREYVYKERKDEQKASTCRTNLHLSSSLVHVPKSKRQARTYLFCTL